QEFQRRDSCCRADANQAPAQPAARALRCARDGLPHTAADSEASDEPCGTKALELAREYCAAERALAPQSPHPISNSHSQRSYHRRTRAKLSLRLERDAGTSDRRRYTQEAARHPLIVGAQESRSRAVW